MPRRDNISPGRVARAERRRKKEEGNEKPRSGLMKLIMMNPGVSLAVFGTLAIIIFAIIAYMLFNANVQMDEILKQYLSLSTRVSDSKRSFTKKKYYITVNADGTTSITINMGTGSMVDDTADGTDEDGGPGFVPDPWNPDDGSGDLDLDLTNSEVAQKLKSAYPDKYEEMALIWDLCHSMFQGDVDNLAIGLMANVANEGSYGRIEDTYSNEGYGKTMTTIAAIKHYRDKSASISCGVGSVQWSFQRRVDFLNICLGIMKNDSDITKANWAKAESEMIKKELSPGSGYYKDVSGAVSKSGNSSPESWAEAFCDWYEKPGGWCGKGKQMSGSGSACKTRRSEATKIAKLLSN